jgi:nicotinate-nucleotide adenylyltransferase
MTTKKTRNILPPHAPGRRIGLFGGTFNPPHDGHRAVSLFALKKLKLDRIWWLVTPGNPLKDVSDLPDLATRLQAAEKLAHHPRIDVTGFEAVIGTQYSCDTLDYLLRECPGVRFVWIMGADNLKNFHRWKNWREIAALLPIAVVDRGGMNSSIAAGPAAQALARARLPEKAAPMLADRQPPAWIYLHGLKSPLSSTALRAEKGTG